jgi:hypothetical protein
MEVEPQARNTPFPDGPDKAVAGDALLDWLCDKYQTRDLVHVDNMSCWTRDNSHKNATVFARANVRVIPMRFEGSAAEFQLAADNGFPARMNLLEALGGSEVQVRRILNPHRTAKDSQSHYLDGVFINSVSLHDPLNTMPLPVGIVSSVTPPVYADMKQKQANELYAELKLEAPKADMLAHIPVSSDGKPDLRPVPLLKDVINAFHATEVCKTFGGLCAEDLWHGLHFLSPADAVQLGFLRPPKEHDFADPPPGMLAAYNSWVIVPMGHILSHISNLPAANIRECGYVVDRLKMPLTGELLPFLIMDLWTVHEYIRSTVASVLLNINKNRVPLLEQWVEVVPLTHERWIEACVANEEHKKGVISFRVVISYITFPARRPDNVALLPMLSEGFPRMDTDYKGLVESEEGKNSVAPKKKKAADAAKEAAPMADATPLTMAPPRDAMEVAGGDDDEDADDVVVDEGK